METLKYLNDSAGRHSTQYYVVNTITIIGILVSMVFICIHLAVHLLANNLHNLPGRNLASFCISLLMEYGCILLSIQLEDYSCIIISDLVNYFGMCSYMWMLVMSYDTWRTIRISVNRLAISFGDKWRRFVVYSVCCWLIPLLYLALQDYLVPKVNSNYEIQFDEKGCPVSEPLLTLLKEGTFLLILLANLVFFASSLCYVYDTNHSIRNFQANHNDFMDHFRLHVRLMLITGLMWTAEELAFYSGIDVLSLAFRTINAFEGLFIAVAFTCRKQVLNSVKFLKCI